MAIDPMLYKKHNGRTTDVGAVLAKSDAAAARRDRQPKGVGGGVRFGMIWGGGWLFWLRWLSVFGRKPDRK